MIRLLVTRDAHRAQSLTHLDRVIARDPLVRWIAVTVNRQAVVPLHCQYLHIDNTVATHIILTDTVIIMRPIKRLNRPPALFPSGMCDNNCGEPKNSVHHAAGFPDETDPRASVE